MEEESTSRHYVLVGPSYPYRGGIAHFMESMHRGLEARGHRVTAITFRRQYPGILFPGQTQYAIDATRDHPDAQRIIDTLNPLTWWKTARYVERLQPDAVVFQHWMPFFAPAYGTIARRLRQAGIEVLAVVHNALPHERRPGDVALSRYFFRHVDGCIVMSHAVEADLLRVDASLAVRTVPHPVYEHFGTPQLRTTAREALGLSQDEKVLLFFGFVRRYKGLHVLLRCMPIVVERLPNVRLVVAGEFYEDESFYRRLIASGGVERHVTLFPDYIPDDRVATFFSAADVVVQPYLSATQSGVAQIAFHFGRPLILTDVGGLAEIVPHERAGLVVPPDDPEALAAAIVRFYDDDMGDDLTQGVRGERAKYGWDRLLDVVETL